MRFFLSHGMNFPAAYQAILWEFCRKGVQSIYCILVIEISFTSWKSFVSPISCPLLCLFLAFYPKLRLLSMHVFVIFCRLAWVAEIQWKHNVLRIRSPRSTLPLSLGDLKKIIELQYLPYRVAVRMNEIMHEKNTLKTLQEYKSSRVVLLFALSASFHSIWGVVSLPKQSYMVSEQLCFRVSRCDDRIM